MRCDIYIMQNRISQIVLLSLPVEETKLKSRSTTNHDIAHVESWHWWLVHMHQNLLTPLFLVILMIISRPVLQYNA